MRVTCVIVVAYCCVTCCVACSTSHLGGASSFKQHNSVDPEVLQLKEKLSLFEAKYERKFTDLEAKCNRDKAISMKEHENMVRKFRSLQEIQEKLDERVKYEKFRHSTSVNADNVFDYSKHGNGIAKPVLFAWYESRKWTRNVYRQITRCSLES